MAGQTKYASLDYYEKKLGKVMSRFGIESDQYDWDCSRAGCWIEFNYKGAHYRFEHSVKKANERGHQLTYGSDAFAQVVLALEDLARLVDRGIYDLQDWVAGMKSLPQANDLPDFCKLLGLNHWPCTREELTAHYRDLARRNHPDLGGSEEFMKNLNEAKKNAERELQSME